VNLLYPAEMHTLSNRLRRTNPCMQGTTIIDPRPTFHFSLKEKCGKQCCRMVFQWCLPI